MDSSFIRHLYVPQWGMNVIAFGRCLLLSILYKERVNDDLNLHLSCKQLKLREIPLFSLVFVFFLFFSIIIFFFTALKYG